MPNLNAGEVKAVKAVLGEAVEEAVGKSHKKWALVVVALLVGAIVAVWLTSRTGSAESTTTAVEAEPS